MDNSFNYLSESDLFRFISNRSAQVPNYAMLLGAGCSISSGVLSGGQLISKWKEELYLARNDKTENLSEKNVEAFLHDKNLVPSASYQEYSYYFSLLYPLESQRANFIENQIDDNKVCPAIGYACLVELAHEKYFDTFFTTNFDDLLNEAFYIYDNQRRHPIVCSQDSRIESISTSSDRVKIIKLHGDYVYGGMRITEEQTANLSQSAKSKLSEFAKKYGLIVIGYSGNDDSIINAIKEIAQDSKNYSHGIFWCIPDSAEVPERVVNLLKDINSVQNRGYIVKIKGFDEFLVDLYNFLFVNKSPINKASSEVKKKLLALYDMYDDDNKLNLIIKSIRKEIGEYDNSLEDERNFISGNNGKIKKYKDISFALLNNDYHKAIAEIEESLNSDVSRESKIALLQLKAECYYNLNNKAEALKVLEELILIDGYSENNYLNYCLCSNKIEERLRILDRGLSFLPYSTRLIARKASELIERNRQSSFRLHDREDNDIIKLLQGGENISKSVYNGCWKLLFDYLIDFANNYDDLENIKKLIGYYFERVPCNPSVLKRYAELMLREKKAFKEIIAFIDTNKQGNPDLAFRYEQIKYHVATKLKEYPYVVKFCKEKYASIDSRVVMSKATALYWQLRDIDSAIELLLGYLNKTQNKMVASLLVCFYLDKEECEKAKTIMDKYDIENDEYKIKLLDKSKEYYSLLDFYKTKIESEPNVFSHKVGYSHTLLMLNEFKEAKNFCKKYLDELGDYKNELGINYFLAKRGDAKRTTSEHVLNELASSDRQELIVAAACYMLENPKYTEKANGIIRNIMEEDFSVLAHIKSCYIFQHYLPEETIFNCIISKLKEVYLNPTDLKEIKQSVNEG